MTSEMERLDDLPEPHHSGRWYLGAMNDALYVLDRPPTNGNNVPPDWPGGERVIAGPFLVSPSSLAGDGLRALIDAHNAARPSPSFDLLRTQLVNRIRALATTQGAQK